jgi:Icc-related predicted phosphoesterase
VSSTDAVTTTGRVVRLAAVGDLHCGRLSPGSLQPLLGQIAAAADVVALCGDLTDHGLPEEARLLAKELASQLKVPTVAVLGNHDYESGQALEITKILEDTGVVVLDGESVELVGIGFAGVKGFGGGFGAHALQAWGEELIKSFVHEAVAEALKLEQALVRLRTHHRVALLHYAPIDQTVQGEPPEIHPFLGSSRLEEPLTRHAPTVIFHGHAHHGQLHGQTRAGTPVYNVAAPLLQSAADGRPFRVLELPTAPSPAEAGA